MIDFYRGFLFAFLQAQYVSHSLNSISNSQSITNCRYILGDPHCTITCCGSGMACQHVNLVESGDGTTDLWEILKL
jgi:hypothetical protein